MDTPSHLIGYHVTSAVLPFSPSLPLSFAAPLEECPAVLSSVTGAAHPPVAEASDTMSGGACTEDGPEPTAEGGCVLSAATEQDEGEHVLQSHPLWLK